MTKAQEQSVQRIRQTIRVLQELAPKETQRSWHRRKHDMENAYATLVLHAGKLHLRVFALSTYYDPQEYLNKANALVRQLIVREITQSIELQKLVWRVQPELGEAIHYEAFHSIYGASPEEIGGVIEMITLHRPDLPILNCTVEWAVLKQRSMEVLP